jgi:hypothetical protein
LDVCFITPELTDAVASFKIEQTKKLPSDHAPVEISLSRRNILPQTLVIEDLNRRAISLGARDTNIEDRARTCRRPIRMRDIDGPRLIAALRNAEPPPIQSLDVDEAAEAINNTLYACAEESKKRPSGEDNTPNQDERHQRHAQDRWISLIEGDDHRALWKAINWKGCIAQDESTNSNPADDEFRAHFEDLLKKDDTTPPSPEVFETAPYIPLTDDPIQPAEVMSATQKLKSNKAGGPSGVAPGVLKSFPLGWFVMLANFFTLLLSTGLYPAVWTKSKLITIYKKGPRENCDNYRGISLMDSIGKLYDAILTNRLQQWMKPDREQAGAQKGRGCIEHLVTLRLLVDYAKSKKKKLYCVFVDFSKAYDRVPRNLIVEQLASLGCGRAMIRAIAATYHCTKMILRTAIITANIGVRQGSPSSCFLFTMVVNNLIRNLKQRCPPDGFLGQLHSLMLMDDTVILSTTKQGAVEKVRILLEFCGASGMQVNTAKTKVMVINGDEEDARPLEVNDISIEQCESYTYLGSVYTRDGSCTTSVKNHLQAKMIHVLKFEAFVRQNSDIPFPAKKRVFTAALMSAILYGSESWLSQASCALASPIYATCVRALLGVRKTTAADLCLAEADLPSSTAWIQEAQYKCLKKLIDDRSDSEDDPFAIVWRLINQNPKTPAAKYINKMMRNPPSKQTEKEELHIKIRSSTRTKFETYSTIMNPRLELHAMYCDPAIPEHERLAVTRLRLSSHNMAIERGRWTRTPREERLCHCGMVQDEPHVIGVCQDGAAIREAWPEMNFQLPDLFEETCVPDAVNACYQLIRTFV